MKRLLGFVVVSVAAWSQTRIDLSHQTRNVDFSQSDSTRPAKTGVILPATCRTGDIFFKLDTPAGQNMFGCTAENLWTQLTGTGGLGATTFQALLTDSAVGWTATEVSLGPGVFRSGSVIVKTVDNASLVASAGSLNPGAQIWLEYDPLSQTRVANSNMFVDQTHLAATNLTLGADDASGFTPGRIPLAYCVGGGTPDEWDECIDMRTPFSALNVHAGSGMQVISESDGSYSLASVQTPAVRSYAVTETPPSCPASWDNLNGVAISEFDAVVPGDVLKVIGIFERSGTDPIEVAIHFAGSSVTGATVMSGDQYVLESEVVVIDSSSVMAKGESRRVSDVLATASATHATGLSIGATPTFEFKANGCATSTIRLMKGFVIHYHDSGL